MGLRLEVLIIAGCAGIALVVCLLGCGCYRFYDQRKLEAEERRVHPRSSPYATGDRRKDKAHRKADEIAVAPKVHQYPVLGTLPVSASKLKVPPPTRADEKDQLGEAGRWAQKQMANARSSAAAAAARGDSDLVANDVVDDLDEDTRPVSASQIDFFRDAPTPPKEAADKQLRAIAAAEAMERQKKLKASKSQPRMVKKTTPWGDDDDDDFPVNSPPPSPPMTGGSSSKSDGQGAKSPKKGMKKAVSSSHLVQATYKQSQIKPE